MRPVVASALAGLMSLSACLQMEQTITLGADGSGTHDVTMTLPDSTFADARRAALANRTGTAIDPLALFTRATVAKELAAVRIDLVEHKSEAKGSAHTVAIRTRFPDPAALRQSPLTGSAAEWEFAPGPKAGTVRVTLYPQGKQAWRDARERALAMPDTADEVTREFFARRKAQLAGLDVKIRFRLPGKVLLWTRNLDKTGEQEVTASITAEQIQTPEELVRRLAPRFEVVFDAAGCSFPVDR